MNSFEPLTVQFFDTSLRDGAQALPADHQFPDGSKVIIADTIARTGVSTIEAGFPATKGDGDEISEVARTVGNTAYVVTPRHIDGKTLKSDAPYIFTPIITGLSRAVPGDIEAAWSAVESARRPGIHTFVSTAPDHMAAKHPHMIPDDVYAMAMNGIRHARAISRPETTIEFSCEAASGTDMRYLERMVRGAVQSGANVVNLPDTLGRAGTKRIRTMFSEATRWIIEEGMQREVTISAHNHDDLSRAVANTITAMQAVEQYAYKRGVAPPTFQAEVTTGGLGERAGNTRFEATVAAMMVDANSEEFKNYPHTYIDTRRIIPTVDFVFAQAGLVIPPQSPVVGRDTRTHRSGIHADGVLKGGASIYSPFDPRHFGADEAAIIEDGKYQGTRGKQHIGTVSNY